jgi:hypothetical protein
MHRSYTTTFLCVTLVGLLFVSSPSAASSGSTTRASPTATNLFAKPFGHQVLAHAYPVVGIRPEGASHTGSFRSVWAGYSQVKSAGGVVGGADGWILPQTHCNSTNPIPQATALLSWFDGLGGENVYGGIAMICGVGQSGHASLYFYDPVGFYAGNISKGDQVTAFVADYDGARAIVDIVDWTSSQYVQDFLSVNYSFAHTDFSGVVDVFAGCATSTGICPQVSFGKILDGTLHDNAGTVDCAKNPDSTMPPYPCVGYGYPLSSSSYFYPIGAPPLGSKLLKDTMVCGDTDCGAAVVFTKTGALQTDFAAHVYKFLLP